MTSGDGWAAAIDVVALVTSDFEGRLLQIRRGPAVAHPGLVCFPGGTVEPGEAIQDALVREAAEELGLIAAVHRQLCTVELEGIRLHAWEGSVSGSLRPDPREVSEVLWLTPQQIRSHPDSMPSSLAIVAALAAGLPRAAR